MDETTARGDSQSRLSVYERAQLEAFIQTAGLNETDAETLRSLTRLLVGGALVGWEELQAHLNNWEREIDQARLQSAVGLQNPESPGAAFRYTMIGLLFEVQDRLVERSKSALDLAQQTTAAFWNPLLRRLDQSRALQPARNRFDRLVHRGESVTRRWTWRGQIEEDRSRRLVRTAAGESFNTSMDLLGQAPALEELIRRQSAGLTQTAVDEVRARTVGGDLIAEHFVRALFRRTPRQQLPITESALAPTEDRSTTS